MTYQILIRNAAEQGYTAQVLALPSVKASAATPAEAVAQARQALAEMLHDAQVVEVEVASHPLAHLAGLYQGDGQFQEVLQDIAAYRAAMTAEELAQWETHKAGEEAEGAS